MAKNGNKESQSIVLRDVEEYLTPVSLDMEDGFECQVIRSLDEGKQVKGEYLGMGSTIETTNQATGEVTEMGSVRLRVAKGVLLDIPETAQLRRLRSVTPGKFVRIARLAQVKTRMGRVCNDYKIDIETDEHYARRAGHAVDIVVSPGKLDLSDVK